MNQNVSKLIELSDKPSLRLQVCYANDNMMLPNRYEHSGMVHNGCFI